MDPSSQVLHSAAVVLADIRMSGNLARCRYWITYEDDDQEEMAWSELKKHLQQLPSGACTEHSNNRAGAGVATATRVNADTRRRRVDLLSHSCTFALQETLLHMTQQTSSARYVSAGCPACKRDALAAKVSAVNIKLCSQHHLIHSQLTQCRKAPAAATFEPILRHLAPQHCMWRQARAPLSSHPVLLHVMIQCMTPCIATV